MREFKQNGKKEKPVVPKQPIIMFLPGIPGMEYFPHRFPLCIS